MENSAIMEQLTEICCDLFGDDEITLSAETTAQDVEGWDSMSNVQLMVLIEQAFGGIKFSTGELANLKNVGEMADAIQRKTSQ